MSLTVVQVDEFKRFWKRDYGEEISDAEAQEYAARLIGFFRVLLDVDCRLRERDLTTD